MVWGHPRGDDKALVLSTAQDDSLVEEGTHVMFDCHGTLDLYCWDGGKTWIAGGQAEGFAHTLNIATQVVAEALISAMKPGVKISELQAYGRSIYRRSGVPNADDAIIFFHGLGLSGHACGRRGRVHGNQRGCRGFQRSSIAAAPQGLALVCACELVRT